MQDVELLSDDEEEEEEKAPAKKRKGKQAKRGDAEENEDRYRPLLFGQNSDLMSARKLVWKFCHGFWRSYTPKTAFLL